MKFRKYFNNKNFSKILAFWILLSNIHINSFASILSNDSRYETFEGDSITINDVLEEDEVDVEIQGNTLVNVLKYESKSDFTWLDGELYEDGYIEINASSDSYKNFFLKKESVIVKPSTTYTFFLEILENTLVKNDGGVERCFVLGGSHNNNYTSYWKTAKWFNGGITGKYSFTLETKDDFSDVITGDRGFVEIATTGKIKFRYMIIEDNHTGKNVGYFKGIKSVGQDNENGHKIEILSQNKNLYSYEKMLNGVQFITKINGTSIKVEKENPYNYNYHESYITDLLVDGKSYTLSADISNKELGNYGIDIVRKSDNYREVVNARNFIADTSKYIYRLKFYSNKNPYSVEGLCSVIYSNIQLEYGNVVTNSVESQFNKQEVLLNEPLRGVPNGLKDRIIKKNGQWVIERNRAEVVLDGSDDEQWSKRSYAFPSETTQLFCFDIKGANAIKDSTMVIQCNRFIPRGGTSQSQREWECIFISTNGNGVGIYLRINNSKLDTLDSDGLNKWLSNNPITVVYRLATPIYEPINFDSLSLYLDTTHISTNSTIPANLRVTVDRVANRAKEYSELAKNNPTSENIALARMWANLMRESILKDGFQSDINTIIKIDDLSLEKKYYSSNIDLYIKSKNSLVMSLNTNSITFDNFSGVENDIKENAVNISVNSSLPYQLNAYLEANIQNSDGSSIIDKSILNIKESGETEYKAFHSINSRLVLKNRCESGNYNQHNIDLKLNGGVPHKKDVYKTTIKFEAEQI